MLRRLPLLPVRRGLTGVNSPLQLLLGLEGKQAAWGQRGAPGTNGNSEGFTGAGLPSWNPFNTHPGGLARECFNGALKKVEV